MRKSLRGAALFATLFAFLPPGLLSQSTKPTPRQWKIIQETPIPDGPAGEISDQVVSPDSRRVAYKLEREGKFSVVVDGVTGNQYDAITDIVFSPDSRRLAYFAAFRGLPATFNPDLVLMKV